MEFEKSKNNVEKIDGIEINYADKPHSNWEQLRKKWKTEKN
jgi:hypothetical protein